MSRDPDAHLVDELLAFGRYLSWADLLHTLFEEEMSREVDSSDAHAATEHEWRWYGLVCHWYSSLHVVVEAWGELGFSDPIIDRLLVHPKQMKALLRQHRNVIYHYQHSLLDPRFLKLLAQGVVHVYWVWALHFEFVRFFFDQISSLGTTDSQRAELRKEMKGVLHWYPYRESPHTASLERILSEGRRILAKCPGDSSPERREIEQVLDSAEATLREGRCNVAALRAHMLREIGIQ
jgi:hypothetical protein